MDLEIKRVSFTRMDQGTPADYALLLAHEREERDELPRRILGMLRELGNAPETGYRINRYQHSLQTATRALRDGADEETIVCALLHDIGDLYAPENHAGFAAAILKPYVSQKNRWIVEHHAIFQGYYYIHYWGGDQHARERYRDHEYFDACLEFCDRWDQVSFDPAYDTLPISEFEAIVRRVLTRGKSDDEDHTTDSSGKSLRATLPAARQPRYRERASSSAAADRRP